MPAAPVESSAASSATLFPLTLAQWDTSTVHRVSRCPGLLAVRSETRSSVLAGFPTDAMNGYEKNDVPW